MDELERVKANMTPKQKAEYEQKMQEALSKKPKEITKFSVPLKDLNDNPTVKVKLENSDAMENMERKIEQYETQLTIVAEKELNRRKELLEKESAKLGIKIPDIKDGNDLLIVEKMLDVNHKSTGNRDLPLNSAQLGNNNYSKSVKNQEFSTVSDMVTSLKEQNTPESIDALKTILKQTQRNGVSTFEFNGSFKKLKEDKNEAKKYKKVR